MKLIKLTLIFSLVTTVAFAQNDVQYTNFMFNKLGYNPAFAGSDEALSIGAIYREQWINVDGAPRTINVHAHMPFFNNKCGVGLAVTSDKIGLMSTNTVELSYAYRMPMGANTLSVGLNGRLEHSNADWRLARGIDPVDAMVPYGETNLFLPNFGFGATFSGDKYFVGASVNQLMNNSNFQHVDVPNQTDVNLKTLYLMGGMEFTINEKVKFMPTVLASYNRNAPFDLDVNAGFMFMNTLFAGLSYRLEDSIDLLLMYQLNKQLRVGGAYDFTTSGLSDKTPGSFEFVASYTFNYDDVSVKNLRFF